MNNKYAKYKPFFSIWSSFPTPFLDNVTSLT